MTPKLAIAASIAGRTPGRRTISRQRGRRRGLQRSPPAEMRSAITFGSGRTVSTSASATSDMPAAASQGTVSVLAADVLAGEERAEDRRAEDRAEDRAEEHERDPACSALGRVHVAGGGADEQGHGPGDADEHEARDDRKA